MQNIKDALAFVLKIARRTRGVDVAATVPDSGSLGSMSTIIP